MVGTVFNIYNKSIFDKFLTYDYNYSNNNPKDTFNQIDRIVNKFDVNIYICYPNLVSILPIKSSLDVHDKQNKSELEEYDWYIITNEISEPTRVDPKESQKHKESVLARKRNYTISGDKKLICFN